MRILAVVALAALAATALAGCSSGGEGISVRAPGAAGGKYVLSSKGSADNYTWDLGDHLTVLYGKRVEHTYDIDNGKVNVRLTTRNGDTSKEHVQEIVLGNGVNTAPGFVLEGQTNWAVVGEPVKFSGAASRDADGDPLRFSWNCIRTGDAIRKGTHSHPVVPGGVVYGQPPPGSVTARFATTALPTADRTLSGDLCDTLGAGGRPSLDATIEGTFTKSGIYDIIMLGSDAANPTTSGRLTLYVTPPSERPSPVLRQVFNGTLSAGSGGNLQGTGDAAGLGMTLDLATHTFSLSLQGIVVFLNVTWDAGPAGQNLVAVALKRGENVLVTPQSQDIVFEQATAGTYLVEVSLQQGVDVDYSVELTALINMDPTQVY